MMDARTITKSLGGMWTGHYGLALCPTHADRKPSLKIKNDPNKRDGIDLICFAGCSWRDVKAELARQGLLDEHGSNAPSPPKRPKSNSKPKLSAEDRTRIALRIWEHATPLKNTLGWRYLTERRQLHIGLLNDDLNHVLRWHAGEHAVIALMTDPISNKPTGIHRTFLNPDGTKRERKMLGPMGVIRLSPDETITQGLGLSEGTEDALAVLLSGWAPVWAASCAGAIKNFPILSGIEALTIFADSNEVGMQAASACADRWEATGREVTIQY
jgi:hypothetical protein